MTNQATLTVAINDGDAQQRIQRLEQALRGIFVSGNNASNSVANVGQTTQAAGNRINSLTGNVNSLNSSTNTAAGNVNTLNQHVNTLGNTTNSTTSSVNTLNSSVSNAANTVNNYSGNVTNLIVHLNDATTSLNQNTNANNRNESSQSAALKAIGKAKAAYLGAAGLIASITGATVAATAFAVEQVKVADELSRLARTANTTTDEIQKYTFGAKALGIEQDKLGDIFKDTQDKVGDFLTTGGGELADFFKYIAPRIGLTAESLRDLSGDKALLAMVNALQKANISAHEMKFFMEGIGDEASALVPMLLNNAEGFNAWYEAAKKAGAVMDKETIKATMELKAATAQLDNQYTAIKQGLVQGFLPVLKDLAYATQTDTNLKKDAIEAGKNLGEAFKFIVTTGYGVVGILRLVGNGLGTFAQAVKDPLNAIEIIRQGYANIGTIVADVNASMDKINGLGTSQALPTDGLAKYTQAIDVVNNKLNSTNEKLLAITGNTARLNQNGSVHLDVRYAKGDARYGKEVTQADLDRLLVNGNTLASQFRKTSGYGMRTLHGKSDFHEGIDFGTPMGTKVSTKVPVKSLKTWDNRNAGGGWVTTVEFMDGVKLNLLHLSPNTADVTRQYATPNLGQTGQQIQAQMDANKKAAEQLQKDNEAIQKANVENLKNLTAINKKVLGHYFANNGSQLEASRGLPQGILAAVMEQESKGNVNARSPVGALGLMQLMPATARRFFSDANDRTIGTANDARRDPAKAMTAAADYLAFNLKKFGGNLEKALAAYNAGEGNVDKYHGIPPFRETRDYVQKVMNNYGFYSNSLKNKNLGIRGDENDFADITDKAEEQRLARERKYLEQSEALRAKYGSKLAAIAKETQDELDKIADRETPMGDDERQVLYVKAQRAGQAKIQAYLDSLDKPTRDLLAPLDDELSAITSKYEQLRKNIKVTYPDLDGKALQNYQDALDKAEEFETKRAQLANDKRLLDLQKDALKPSDFENQSYALKQREIELSNSSIKQQELVNQAEIHQRTLDNISAEAQVRLASLNEYKLSAIDKINAIADAQLKALKPNSETYQAEVEHIEFVRKRDIELYRINQREMLNGVNQIGMTELQRINAKWDLEKQRREAEQGRPLDKDQQSALDAQRETETKVLQTGQHKEYESFTRQMDMQYDPLASIKEELRSKTELLKNWRENESISQEEFEKSQLEMQKNYQLARQQNLLGSFSSAFSALTGLTKSFAGEQSKTYKTMFYAEKAFNFASVMLNSFGALSKAWNSAPFPANLMAVGVTAAQTGVLQAGIQALAPKGFMTGGYTGNGLPTEVAGLVHKQEYVFTAQQTKSIGADNLHALATGKPFGNAPVVNVYNNAPVEVSTRTNDNGGIDVYIEQKVKQAFSNLANPHSYESKMVKTHTTARPLL